MGDIVPILCIHSRGYMSAHTQPLSVEAQGLTSEWKGQESTVPPEKGC